MAVFYNRSQTTAATWILGCWPQAAKTLQAAGLYSEAATD
jgi:hypothetical protein